ncbi:MAG TPA: type II toxin-antitoxin system RelE/ParE family toxin [Gemmataceae bacterium]|jgi:plasmid stabilization system protein ParE|nr:type II toxin-antitoxin system RelE/ParE family toxin [Gemmataceae bacterium]
MSPSPLATYRIVISPQAGAQLEEIFGYIAQRSPQNAPIVIDRILTAIDSLKTMPSRFKVERHDRRLGYDVHSMVVAPHLVFYRVIEPDRVVRILSVRHGARRRPRRFE